MFVSKISVVSVALTALIVPTAASASSFTRVFAFGDSLTDNGNIAFLDAPNFQEVPFGGLGPSTAYEGGRFTNGPTWAETLANRLGVNISASLEGGTNYAYGRARTGPLGAVPPAVPSLLDQFGSFQTNTGGVAPSDALYVIWGASNDGFDAGIQKQLGNDPGATAILNQAVNNVTTIITELKDAGAETIVVPNVVDLGTTPIIKRNPTLPESNFTTVAVEYNTLLRSALEPFRDDPSINLIEIDAFTYFASIFTSPESFGITNTSDPCVDLDTVCSNPNEFLFYDGLHPTVTFHRQFGEFVASQVTVPEPSSTIGIFLVTGIGLLLSKRKIWH